mmetsp:Transcript_10866/g.50168  ORF Transcript_10866/g.50168 Transcript_10866/m.50168 type:complete len:223 (+) Transcript_10866:743-1411(+)
MIRVRLCRSLLRLCLSARSSSLSQIRLSLVDASSSLARSQLLHEGHQHVPQAQPAVPVLLQLAHLGRSASALPRHRVLHSARFATHLLLGPGHRRRQLRHPSRVLLLRLLERADPALGISLDPRVSRLGVGEDGGVLCGGFLGEFHGGRLVSGAFGFDFIREELRLRACLRLEVLHDARDLELNFPCAVLLERVHGGAHRVDVLLVLAVLDGDQGRSGHRGT